MAKNSFKNERVLWLLGSFIFSSHYCFWTSSFINSLYNLQQNPMIFLRKKKTNLYTQWCNTPLFCVAKLPIDSIQYMETYSMGLCYAKDGINIRWYEYFNSTTKFDQSRNRDMRPVLCFSLLWHNISRTRKFIQKVLFQFCSTCSTSGHALTKSKLGFLFLFQWTWCHFKNKFRQMNSP